MILKRIKTIEDFVVKVLLAQFIPYMLDWVEFRRIRWQGQQFHVLWRLERTTGVPACTVEHHDDLLIRVACAHLVQKQLHALGVDVRQNQRIELTALGLHCRIGVGILVGQHGLA